MKRLTTLFVAALIVMSLVTVGTAMAAKNGPAGESNVGHVYVVGPDEGSWGKMQFKFVEEGQYDFVFNGHGLDPDKTYKLEIVEDTTIEIIVIGNPNHGGNIHFSGSTSIDPSLVKLDYN